MKKSILFCTFILLFLASPLEARQLENFSADAESVEPFVFEGEQIPEPYQEEGETNFTPEDEEEDSPQIWMYPPFYEDCFPSVVA